MAIGPRIARSLEFAETQDRIVVRSNGARLHPETQGLTVGVFGQSTSRADNPQLHTHVVISSKVQTVDGRWYALDALMLKKYQQAFSYLYQSVLRAELTARYGVVFDPIVNGQAEIAGVPLELLDQFSKRAREIGVEMGGRLADFSDREGPRSVRLRVRGDRTRGRLRAVALVLHFDTWTALAYVNSVKAPQNWFDASKTANRSISLSLGD